MKNLLFLITAILIVSGCGGGGSSSSNIDDNNIKYPESQREFTITQNNQIESIKKTSNSTIKLNVEGKKKIYVVVTSRSDNQDISIDSSVSTTNSSSNYKINTKSKKTTTFITPQNVLDYRTKAYNKLKSSKNLTANKKELKLLPRVTSEDDKESFYIDVFDSSGASHTKEINATARKVIANVDTKYGKKTLVVWVEDDVYSDGGLISNGTVTQDMVDNLADIFLADGESNDIYDWVTNVYGKEWGDTNYNILIDDNGYIDILIDDMELDEIAGYFYSKDNFVKSDEPTSNEKIMFYINSRVYTRSGYSQEENEKEVYTTLAHEFQHMIHFYQRGVLKRSSHPTWLNEMLSEATEDLVATKIEYKGPRNVDPSDGSAGSSGNSGGRYPDFNEYNYLSLTSWSNSLKHYSKVSAFGAFLLRNYNGAKVLHDILHSSKTGYEAIEDATGKDLKALLREWAEAVILSSEDNLPQDKPAYNFGDFKEVEYNGITYDLGSINFFNYNPTPTFKSSATLDNNANLYYYLGEIEGEATINVDIPLGADITIISK
jgi:hypothetical protein